MNGVALVRLFGILLSFLSLAMSCAALAQTADVDYELFDQHPETVYGSKAVYRVSRNGKNIGQHQLRFSQQGEQLTVEAESNLVVRMLGITLYTYRYVSKEFWQAQQLLKVQTQVFDHRKPEKTILAEPKKRLWYINNGGQNKIAALPDFPSNHWHPGVLSAKRLFHTLHGKVYKINLKSLGWEKVALASGDIVSARHYRYRDGFIADVWYDKDHRWIKLMFKADDGSKIEYTCEVCGY